MTNIYTYSFYLFYKFGVKIKTPEPEFAATCLTSAVMIIQLVIALTFLDALGIFTGFISSPLAKPIGVAVGFFILHINFKYVFGIKKLKYLELVRVCDKDSFRNKVIKTAFTVFIIIIVPIICGILIWDSRNNNAYIQRIISHI